MVVGSSGNLFAIDSSTDTAGNGAADGDDGIVGLWHSGSGVAADGERPDGYWRLA
jgi:hypothetical protein